MRAASRPVTIYGNGCQNHEVLLVYRSRDSKSRLSRINDAKTPSFIDRLFSEASVTVFSVALPFRRSTASRATMRSATGFTGDCWRLAWCDAGDVEECATSGSRVKNLVEK